MALRTRGTWHDDDCGGDHYQDEERNIADCLASVRWADELIVVDAESRDRTVELAKGYTSKVFVRAWPGYGPQKNFGIDQAEADWILVVDADERVTDELRQEIQSLLAAGPPADIGGYEIPAGIISTGNGFKAAGSTRTINSGCFAGLPAGTTMCGCMKTSCCRDAGNDCERPSFITACPPCTITSAR